MSKSGGGTKPDSSCATARKSCTPCIEGVADACLDDLSELASLEDLSTPGAFWLNPCMPRDAEGYSVDPRTGRRYENNASAGGTGAADGSDDAAVAAILRDMQGG